jgi:transposase
VRHHSEAFVGIDTSKLRNAVAIAEGGRGGEVRYVGAIDATEAATRKLVTKLAAKYQSVAFCYEAGPTGYGLYRLIRSLGHDCLVAAPSLIPKKPGDRVKTNRRDAVDSPRFCKNFFFKVSGFRSADDADVNFDRTRSIQSPVC